MSDLLRRNALDRTFLGSYRGPCNGLDHFAGAIGICDPLLVKVVRTYGFTTNVFTRVDLAGIAAVYEFEEMIFRLHVVARVADQRLGECGVLDAVILLAALAERAAIEPDDRGMTEIGVDAVEAGGVRDGHIDVIRQAIAFAIITC